MALSEQTGETTNAILKRAIDLYREQAHDMQGPQRPMSKLAKILGDKTAEKIFREQLSKVNKSAAKLISKKVRKARSKAGGEARKQKYTPEELSALAKKSWATKRANKKAQDAEK